LKFCKRTCYVLCIKGAVNQPRNHFLFSGLRAQRMQKEGLVMIELKTCVAESKRVGEKRQASRWHRCVACKGMLHCLMGSFDLFCYSCYGYSGTHQGSHCLMNLRQVFRAGANYGPAFLV
jgi:hypothetical protein